MTQSPAAINAAATAHVAASAAPEDARLARLLEHPAIWRGRGAARASVVPTGFPELDAVLPGSGWPQVGLVEILISRLGVGELELLLPALAAITQKPQARWCAWIVPAEPFAEAAARAECPACPLEPYAPALAAHGVNLPRLLIVRAEMSAEADGTGGTSLWACEQALRSGACDAAVAWIQRVPLRALRRLQLAAERGRTLAFLFRGLSTRAVREPSAAMLRIAVQPARGAVRATILKSRGSLRGAVYLSPRGAADCATAGRAVSDRMASDRTASNHAAAGAALGCSAAV